MNDSALPVSSMEEEQCLPNPQRCESYSRHMAIQRRVWCQNYDQCLDCAVKQHWEGFTCAHCDAFESISMSSDWLAHEADRCRALAYILARDDIRGKHFRRLAQYFRMERVEFQSDLA